MDNCGSCSRVQEIIDLKSQVVARKETLIATINSLVSELAELREENIKKLTPDSSVCPVTTNPQAYFYPWTAKSSSDTSDSMAGFDITDWRSGGVNQNSKVNTAPCKCNGGIPRGGMPSQTESTMIPQAVGDATIPVNPGSITGAVPITRYYPRGVKPVPQAIPSMDADTIREIQNYAPGPITGAVPIDARTQILYFNTW